MRAKNLRCRWTDVLTKAMPPFQKWALPAALSGLLGAGGPGEEDSRAAAALPYTFPDLPPKACSRSPAPLPPQKGVGSSSSHGE